jgi:hypothetical protein
MTKPLEWWEVIQMRMFEEFVERELSEGVCDAKAVRAMLDSCRDSPDAWRKVRAALKECLDREAQRRKERRDA